MQTTSSTVVQCQTCVCVHTRREGRCCPVLWTFDRHRLIWANAIRLSSKPQHRDRTAESTQWFALYIRRTPGCHTSATAFDTIDDTIMITRFRDRFGITATCLAWFQSYLANRCQSIQMHDRISAECPVVFGVQQGSVLGPLMFICYTAPLGDIARRRGINDHLYADDTQLYIAFSSFSSGSEGGYKHVLQKSEYGWVWKNWTW